MKGINGLLAAACLALVIGGGLGCAFQAAGQPFPSAQQMLTACSAEKAAGIPQGKAPDCLAWWAVSEACGVQAVANLANPIIIQVAAAANPLAGSVINAGATIDTTICKKQGFLK